MSQQVELAEGPGWHSMDGAAVCSRLGAGPEQGLSAAEAASRLARHGENTIRAASRSGLPRLLVAQFRSALVLVLTLAAALSLVQREWLDGGVILLVLLLNAGLGGAQEFQAQRALAALQDLAPPQARVIRDGVTRRIPAAAVVPGDLLAVDAGDSIAADARIIESHGLHVNESILTGESFPVTKQTEPVAGEVDLAERASMLYSGTVVTRGSGRAIVVATGPHSEVGRTASLVGSTRRERTPLEASIDVAARWLAAGAAAAAVVVFAVTLLLGGDLEEAFLTAVALAVAAIPEGLPAAITLVLAAGVRRMAARHAIVRRLSAVETLGRTEVICADKTGTLTQNVLAVASCWCGGTSYPRERLGALPFVVREAILQSLGPRAIDGRFADPTDVALAEQAAGAAPRERHVTEHAFDADRMRSSHIYRLQDGRSLVAIKGAAEAVLQACNRVWSDESLLPLDASRRAEIARVTESMAVRGLRPIGVATREAEPAEDVAQADSAEREATLVAVFGLADQLRPEVVPAVRAAQSAGVRTVMITGDHPATARAIAAEAGLAADPNVMAAAELRGLDDAELDARIASTHAFARVTSADKLRIVRAFKRSGAIIAMTGDGVNDAPALQEADVGVAMGNHGTDAARGAADLVLTDDNYATIVTAIEHGRAIFANIRRFLAYLLAGNTAEIAVVLLGSLSGHAALLPVQILWINLVTDGPPALALGMEPPERDVMRRPPRSRRERILAESLLPSVTLSALLIAVPSLAAFAIGLRRDGIEEARVLAFATLITAHLLTSLVFRSSTVPLYRLGLRSNPWLAWALAGAFGLQVLAFSVPPLQAALGTRSFSGADLILVAVLSLPSLVVPDALRALGVRIGPRFRRDNADRTAIPDLPRPK